MRLKKQDLQSLNLDNLDNLPQQEFEQHIENLQLYNYSTWLLPQLVAHFGTWRLGECGKTTVLANCDTSFKKVLWRLTRVKRGLLVKNQTKEPEYAKLTPLIMLGFRRNQNKTYESWRNYPNLEWILEPDLYNAVQSCEVPSSQRLVEITQQGLLIKTGKNSGSTRVPTSTWQLYGIQDTEIGNYPKLQQTILTQCWLAHPQLRRETMILDPNNWDLMPKPNIEAVELSTKSSKETVWF